MRAGPAGGRRRRECILANGLLNAPHRRRQSSESRKDRSPLAHDELPEAGLVSHRQLRSVSLLLTSTRRRLQRIRPDDRLGKPSIARVPLALVNLFRIAAFQSTVPLGSSYCINLAEAFLTAAYLAVVLTWSLINCTSYAPPPWP